jgi:Uncharacterized conserved protein (DUF2183)
MPGIPKIVMSRRTTVLGALAGTVMPTAGQAAPSDVSMAFDTAAHLDVAKQTWVIPLHAWAYRPQDSSIRKALIAKVFERTYGLSVTPERVLVFDRRINLLLADNLRGQRPLLTVAQHGVAMPPTGANGHTMLDLRLPVSAAAPATGGIIQLGTAGSAQTGRVHLVAPTGVSIISDIDDTVKISGVLDKAQLWRSTFYEPFRAVPGMAELLRRLGGADAAVHYVSSSPWHLYAPLREWLAADGFPVSALHLKQVRLKDRTALDIAKSPGETKPPVITALLKRYPQRRFILIGDSGEKDPEVYGDAARRFPAQVTRILIRRAPGDRTGAGRFKAAFKGLSKDLWQIFDEPTKVT